MDMKLEEALDLIKKSIANGNYDNATTLCDEIKADLPSAAEALRQTGRMEIVNVVCGKLYTTGILPEGTTLDAALDELIRRAQPLPALETNSLAAVWDMLSPGCQADIRHGIGRPGAIIRCTADDWNLIRQINLSAADVPGKPS